MTIEQIEEITEIQDVAPKAAEDTTMEGNFSPDEQEGLAEYNKIMEAMERGEDYDPASSAADIDPEKADAGGDGSGPGDVRLQPVH